MDVPVNAHVEVVNSMSAHADSREMLRWLRGFKQPPKRTFLVHGEPVAMQALNATITSELKWNVHMPQWNETVDLK
jgi:metallo-beta-lactamase family protein